MDKFLDAGVREIQQSEDYSSLLKEVKFLTKHPTCTDAACNHCASKPVHTSAEDIVALVCRFLGGHVPIPTKSVHYYYLLEMESLVEVGQDEKLAGLDSCDL